MVEAADWQNLANALRELHRVLIECARRDYEREHAVALSPAELLRLLTTHADFDWLRSLSELMVDLDLVGDAAPLHRDELTIAIRAAVEHVLSVAPTDEPAGPFALKYLAYLHDHPQVAMAHAGVKRAINAWPRPQKSDAAGLLHERHRLAETARHLSRRDRGPPE
jgi:hypothetical protein